VLSKLLLLLAVFTLLLLVGLLLLDVILMLMFLFMSFLMLFELLLFESSALDGVVGSLELLLSPLDDEVKVPTPLILIFF